jgi:hypothetical protein
VILGQQQLLLIILGVIIVGIAIFLGIMLFRQNSIDHKRDLFVNEGLTIANSAFNFYHKPINQGGGGKSFSGWYIPSQMINTPNGHFRANTYSERVEIFGTGNDVITGTDFVEVKFVVTSKNIKTEIIH